jgi:NAD(P) transhydrogenase subunit alpha
VRGVKVVVPAETRPGERRVALVPDAVPKLLQAGLQVLVESGAGRHVHASDDAYRAAGAVVVDGDPVTGQVAVLSVVPIDAERVAALAPGSVTISFLPAVQDPVLVQALLDQQVTSFAVELVPRISRAQSMDVLTSQALVAG